MATFRSGQGGFIQVSLDGVSYQTLNLAVWELDESSRDTENSHSGVGGSTNYEHVINDEASRLQIPWDEEQVPEAIGLRKGQKVYIRFKHGSGAVIKQLSRTLVSSMRTVCDNQQDIVRVEIPTKGGTLS